MPVKTSSSASEKQQIRH